MAHKTPSAEHYALSVGARGRLVLPARVRRRLNLHPGSSLILTVDSNGSINLRPASEVVDRFRGLYKHLVPPGASLAEQLIRERRREARRENGR
jgi:AbrB family looped-hinge helix DNA binding protein